MHHLLPDLTPTPRAARQQRSPSSAGSVADDTLRAAVRRACRLKRQQAEGSLTPEMRGHFDLFLYVSKADHGPLAQRMYVFQQAAAGRA